MGPKYEFTDETMNHDGYLLHRIKRLSDGKLGGWIEKEYNLSQYDSCWISDEAKVYGEARVYGDAKVYDTASVKGNAKVFGHTEVNGDAQVYGNANVFDNACVWGNAEVFDNAKVYGDAQVYGNAKVCGNAEVCSNVWLYDDVEVCSDTKVKDDIKIDNGKYTSGEYYCDEESSDEVVKDFIYKVDDSNKITTQTEYDSIDEFFSAPITNDIKLDTIILCTIDTKEPIIKLQKVNNDGDNVFKYIVEITSENGDDFIVRSTIKTQEQLNQLIQQTIDSLRNYPQFSKYAEDLENCL